MKKIYAPWRHDYVTKMSKQNKKDITKHECVFCAQVQEGQDDKYFIIRRFAHSFVMMNLYPYNAGHVMILPYDHKGNLADLTPLIRAEMMEVVSVTERVMTEVLKAEGYNVGINLGIAGGGGIPAHIHIHVLPRWKGDTNFLETIGQTKLISADLVKTFNDLKEGFASVTL